MSKNLITYSIIAFVIIPIFGINFVISLIGNVFLLLILIPTLLLIVALITFNSIKTKSNTCNKCGLTTIGDHEKCIYCGSEFNINFKDNELTKDASKEVIEIEAEEIK
tara:strand:- start:40496 stop:40819 length:324 start_codon:yes stop_codon:yes gene_type:complete